MKAESKQIPQKLAARLKFVCYHEAGWKSQLYPGNDKRSRLRRLNNGVQHGSVLAPFLFQRRKIWVVSGAHWVKRIVRWHLQMCDQGKITKKA